MDWISPPSFVNLNIISYRRCARFVCLNASRYSKCLFIDYFFLTCWLKPNRGFFSGQLLIIPPESLVLGSNSPHKADDNHHFITKGSEKARYISLPTKAVAICARKNVGHYYQNNDQSSKLLLIRLDQFIV